MKLLTFIKEGRQAFGVKTDAGVIDIELACSTVPAVNATVLRSELSNGCLGKRAMISVRCDLISLRLMK